MASNISNAVGIQRQFTAQQQGLYQKRLSVPNFTSSPVSSNEIENDLLSRSLGVLTYAVDKYKENEDKRLKEVNDKVTTMLYNSQSLEARITKSSIATLTSASKEYGSDFYDIVDNPYALATIDRLRGQELSAITAGEYQQKMATNPLKGSVQEQVKDYEEYRRDRLKELIDDNSINNKFSFNDGLYEGNVVQATGIAKQYREQKTKELYQQRASTMLNMANNLTYNTDNISDKEKRSATLSTIFTALDTTATSDPEFNSKLLAGVVERLASNSADPSLIDEVGEYTFGGTPIKDLIPLSDYRDLAINKSKQYLTVHYRDLLDTINKCTTEQEVYSKYDSMSTDDKRTISSMIPHRVNEIKMEQERIKRLRESQSKALALNMMAGNNVSSVVQAIITGSHTFSGRSSKTGMYGTYNLPQTESDLNDYGISEDMLGMQLNQVLSSVDSTSDEGLRAVTYIASNPLCSRAYGNLLTNNTQAEIAQLTPEGINNMQGNYPNLYRALQYANTSPFLLQSFIKDDDTRVAVEAINTVGVEPYLQSRDTLIDSNKRSVIDKQVKNSISSYISSASVSNGDGTEYTGGSYTDTHWDKFSNIVQKRAEVYTACGMTTEQALDKATKQTSNEFTTFYGTPFPNTMFQKVEGDYSSNVKRKAFTDALSYLAEYNGITITGLTPITYGENGAGNQWIAVGDKVFYENDILYIANASLEQQDVQYDGSSNNNVSSNTTAEVIKRGIQEFRNNNNNE